MSAESDLLDKVMKILNSGEYNLDEVTLHSKSGEPQRLTFKATPGHAHASSTTLGDFIDTFAPTFGQGFHILEEGDVYTITETSLS